MQFGLRGYNNTVTTACAASTQAMGDALDVIRIGRADVMVAGGGEAGICELGLAAFHIMRALSTREDEPMKASRPFDADRDGFVCAEGAALFVLETLEHAERRGARILAEIAGYGATSDAYHVVAPCVDGEGAQRAMLDGNRRRRPDAGRHRLHQRPRHLDASQRRLRDIRDQGRLFGERAYRSRSARRSR